jgi:hypothetical protein
LAGNDYSIAGVSKTASLTLANTQYVLSTAPDYGVGGTGGAKTATLPAANTVWHTASAFGVGGTGSTPSKVASSIANCSAGNLKKDVVIDDVTGTLDVTSDNATAITNAVNAANTDDNKLKIVSGETITIGGGTLGGGTAPAGGGGTEVVTVVFPGLGID